MKIFLIIKLTILSSLISGTTAFAQSNAEVREFLSGLIAEKDPDIFRSFLPTTMHQVKQDQCEYSESSYCSHQDLRDQLPPGVRNIGDNEPIRVLYIVGCDVYARADGTIGIVPDGDVVRTSMIQQIRVNTALRGAGINSSISEDQASSLGWNYNFPDPNSSMKEINAFLLDQFRSDVVSVPHFVFDDSQCGDGEIEVFFEVDDGFSDVQIIEEGYFHFCDGRSANPWDRRSCIWWDDIGFNLWIAGVYIWQATQPDGARVWGRVDVEDLADRTVRIPN